MLTLLTATGCRPKAWEICKQLILGQTYAGPVHWIIVDDGETPQLVNFKKDNWLVSVVRPTPFWSQGQNTQCRNLLEGLSMVMPNDRLVIVEDDDFYAPEYLSNVAEWLDKADLVGECMARYYNVPFARYRQLTNTQHASLCSTAMKGDAIKEFAKACESGDQFVDIRLWRNFLGSKMLKRTQTVVGIKGLPGRGGIGMGHKRDFAGTIDRDGSVLREWVGEFADVYRGF